MLRSSFILPACLLLLLACLPLSGQQSPAAPAQSSACAMPAFSKVVNEPNLFNEQQEEWLGEILDEQVLKQYNPVEDPEDDSAEADRRIAA